MQTVLKNALRMLRDSGAAKDVAVLAAALLALLCSFSGFSPLPFDAGWVTIALCGVPIIRAALTALITRLDIRSDFLVSLALLAALAIGEIFAAAEIAFIMQLGALLEEITVRRTQRDIKKLAGLAPRHARLLEGDTVKIIDIDRVRAGDILRVLPDDTVPVDGTIIEGNTTINQAVMTGESLPVDKSAGDKVMSGTLNLFGAFTLRADATGENSSFKRMLRLVESADASKAEIVSLADCWATRIVFAALLTAAATWYFTGEIIRAVTILVVFCPCSLVLATPTAVMAAIGNASRNSFLVKAGDALERLAQVKEIIFDKTGTLTYGRLEVTGVISVRGDITAEGLYFLAASAESLSEHPLGEAITRCYSESRHKALLKPENFRLLPGLGVEAKINGRELYLGSRKLLKQHGIELSREITKQAARPGSRGASFVYIAIDGSAAGFITLADALRPTSKYTLDSLRAQGLESVLLTGDSAPAARAIALAAGISRFRANCLPQDKMAYISSRQAKGQKLCMIGDGINDAPALKAAHVGIAMGGIGSDIAVEAADIILVQDDLVRLPHLFALSRRMLFTIKLNLIFSLLLNFTAITLAVTGYLSPVVGALVHNGGSVMVIINSVLLLNWQQKGNTRPPQAPAPLAEKVVCPHFTV